MKNNYLSLGVLALGMFFAQSTFAQTNAEKQRIIQTYDQGKLKALEVSIENRVKAEKEEAYQIAAQRGWDVKIETQDGRLLELQKVVDGKPIYYTTFNVDAARSTRTNHLNAGGSLGLNLMGQNMTAFVWDGGIARASHQEYDGAGGTNRFSAADSGSLNFHAAHVTGTIIASGVVADAKGMAPHARAIGYDWNSDKSEATSEASGGMLVSNHSYGFRGDLVPDYYFGAYITESRDWDEIMFNAPNYLMIVAAGNDGNQNSYNGSPLAGNSSYDKLTGHSTSKNNLVVANAQDANVDASGNLISVTINSGSSEGPTDDYRIKPDITGNGTGLYSTYHNSNTAYNSISGTSMASPNVSGSVLLLQQHYNATNGSFARAATMKGLVLHTADDAGPNGPDAAYGWGLMNAKRAAETITNDGSASRIEQLTLTSGQSYSITVDSDGVSPLLASISWTDRAGTATTATNSSTPVLVNDLDIRVTKGGATFSPWRLTGVTTNGTGDNVVDPYERVDVSGASGTYTITVTHKGSLVGGSQNFSLIVTGLSGGVIIDPPTFCSTAIDTFPYSEGFESGDGWTQVGGDNGDWYRTSGSTPSSGTGPTAAAEGSSYLFLEASTNGSPGQIGNNGTAILESDCFNLAGLTSATFSFKNHMYGTAVGSITVQASTDGVSWADLWTDSGDKGNQWNDVSVNLNAYVGQEIKLRIVGTTGSGWSSDIAIDDLAVTSGGGGSGPSGCTGGITAFPYSESFENTFGAWAQSSADDINWSVTSGGTPSSNTGPSSATAGTYYIFVEASGNGTGYPNKQAILNSPCFDLSGESQATFSFSYHMYGAADMGSIALEASDDNGATWTSLWSETGNKGNAWQTASVDLAAYVGGSVQLRFNRITGATWQADIAIDGVSLSTSGGGAGPSCSNVSLSITFDNYPEETSWEITNSGGTVVASGGTYGSQPDGSTLNIDVGCLDDGCYDFTITDAYGDGICCAYGNGSFTLTNNDSGATLASGGSFTTSDTTNFCLTASATSTTSDYMTTFSDDSPTTALDITIYPNPVKGGTLHVTTTQDTATYTILNIVGQQVAKGNIVSGAIDVQKLKAGVYMVQINAGTQTVTKKFIKQ
ncbi:MAG: S8 family serine peptidase [Bacteroidota bacterium]